MTLHAELIELGWIALIRRLTGLRPSEAFALRHLLRNADRTISISRLGEAYDLALRSGAVVCGKTCRPITARGIRKRIERARAALVEMGCAGAIQTVMDAGYLIAKPDVLRIEEAITVLAGYGESEAA